MKHEHRERERETDRTAVSSDSEVVGLRGELGVWADGARAGLWKEWDFKPKSAPRRVVSRGIALCTYRGRMLRLTLA